MLLKTRREFTLCYLLFAPLGMAGYCAGVKPADTPVQSAKPKTTNSKSHADVAKKGGQPAPQSPGGGLSSAEQLSRLLVDGRRAFRDGEMMTASSYFRDALKLDTDNEEAQKFLKEIEQKSGGARFSPEGLSAQIPAGTAGKANKVDVVGTVEAVRSNANPSPITQSLSGNDKISVNNTVSMAMSANSNSFSKPVSVAVAMDPQAAVTKSEGSDKPAKGKSILAESAEGVSWGAPVKPSKDIASAAAADAGVAEKAARDEAKTKADDAAEKLKQQEVAAEKAAAEKAAKESKEAADRAEAARLAKEQAESDRAEKLARAKAERDEAAKVAAKLAEEQKAERLAKAAADKEKADKLAAEKAEKAQQEKLLAEKAEQEKAEKLAAELAEREKSERLAAEKAKKAEQEKLLAEKAEKEKAEKLAADKAARAAAEIAKREEAEKLAAEKLEKAKQEKLLAEKEKADKLASEKAAKLAAETAEREKAEKEIAARKAEKEQKAAEEAQKAEERKLAEKKAEEARQIAAAEKEAKEAAEKAEKEQKLAAAKAEKAQFNKAVEETNAGIKLYNAGKYDEAHKKFEFALATQPDYREAANYLERSERKISDAAEKAEKAKAPALNLDSLKDDLKEVAQASSEAKIASSVVTTETTKSISGAGGASPSTEDKSDVANADPIVQSDKLLREAQTSLSEGNRDKALELAQEAAKLDPKNVGASSLVKELGTEDAAGSLPSLGSVTAAASADTKADVKVESDKAVEATSLDVTAAPEPVSPPVIGDSPSGVSSLLTEGRSKFESGQLREAQTAYKAALEIDPENVEAKTYIKKIEVARAGEGVPMPSIPGGPRAGTAQSAQEAEAAFQQGLVAYQAGRLDVAVQHWNFSLTLDPNHPRAVQYLEQTRPEYEAWVQQHQYNALELQKEVSSTNKLETPVTYDSAGPKTLVEFLQAMSLITDISFYVADGVDSELHVTAKFDQQDLQDALDIVLLPIGLKWHRTGDVVTVTTDLHNKFYNLTPDQVARLKPLLENNTLQRYLYGPEGVPPMRNVELLLDDRENLLVVTDSAENLNKIEAFLKDLQVDAPQQLVFKNWKIRPEEAQRIKALVEAIVKVNSDAAWDLERRVVVDGDDLIVKDSADNVAKIEQLLLDKNFLKKLENQTLGVQTYSLIPREPIGPENVEQARDMAQSVVTVVKTILYSQSGEEAAAAEGRRFWYDPNTLQLTITDFPNNLGVVGDYLKSLPTLSASSQKSEIIKLRYQTATDMKSLLEQVLGLKGGFGISGGGLDSANAVTKTLRTEGEMTYGDLSIRVKRIEGSDDSASTENDKSATLIVRTATNSQDVTIEEFDTEFVDEYEITAEDIRPSGSNDGEGSIRLSVRVSAAGVVGAGYGGFGGYGGYGGYGGGIGVGVGPNGGVGVGIPGVGAIAPNAPGSTLAGALRNSIREQLDIVIENIPNMNALLIRYEDPSDLDEVKNWLTQLDIPVLQVAIETKLVEVNESRAKEFMPELNMANIGQGSPDFSNNSNFFDFAKNDFVGELGRSPFDPFPEDPFNAGLLKGTSVFNIITGGKSPISFTLRALESEGVVNLTNGPTVTVVNGETADFRITRDFGLQSVSTGNNNDDNGRIPRIDHVRMTVTPQITEGGEISLDITDLQLNDFGNQIQNIFPIVIGNTTGSGGGGGGGGVGGFENGLLVSEFGLGVTPPAIVPGPTGNVPYEVRRRTLSTVARVRNHGTIVLGGWMGERSRTNDSGVPILRNLPYVGKLLFGRTSDKIDRTNLLIFLTCNLIDP